jgi:hypothetical protein
MDVAAMRTRLHFRCVIAIIAAWAVSGPAFHYSDTWQLIINTGTTIYCDPAELDELSVRTRTPVTKCCDLRI